MYSSSSKLYSTEIALLYSDAELYIAILTASEFVDIFIKDQDFTDVVIALGSRDFRGGEIRYNGTKNVVDSLMTNGKNAKIHVISANGVGNSWSNLKWHEKLMCKLFISKAMKDHELQEKVVCSNVGGYHIIRPVGLKNEAGTGKIHAETERILPSSSMTRADVATYLVDSMNNNISGKHSICNI